nr:GNAT family N-acetyltransferase [uncultured Desulfobacter sp.]
MELNWSYHTDNIDWDELSMLYTIAPLGIKPVDYLKKVLKNSMFKCFVYHKTKLIGAGRAVADGMDCAYLCDIVVHPEFQGKGIGKSIVHKLLARSEGHKKIILYANPGKEAFYEKLGFKPMMTAMAIFQDQDAAVKSGLVKDR